jgi:hypothetical protein
MIIRYGGSMGTVIGILKKNVMERNAIEFENGQRLNWRIRLPWEIVLSAAPPGYSPLC